MMCLRRKLNDWIVCVILLMLTFCYYQGHEDFKRPVFRDQYQIENADVLTIRHIPALPGANVSVPLLSYPQLRVLMYDLVEGRVKQSIKYITLGPILPTPFKAKPVNITLPSLPSGDWNWAELLLKYDSDYGMSGNYDTQFSSMPSLSGHAWHPVNIDYLALEKIKTLSLDHNLSERENDDHLQVVRHPDFDKPMVMKIASFPDYEKLGRIGKEMDVYNLISGSKLPDIAPRYLGQVTEDGRVIGFLMEYLEDAVPAGRIWSVEASQACRTTLHELHGIIGVAHRDAHRHNCLIRKDGSAVLIGFERASTNPTLRMFLDDGRSIAPVSFIRSRYYR